MQKLVIRKRTVWWGDEAGMALEIKQMTGYESKLAQTDGWEVTSW